MLQMAHIGSWKCEKMLFFVVSLAVVTTVFGAAVFKDDDCLSVTNNYNLSTTAPSLTTVKSLDLSDCVAKCIAEYPSNCTRVVHNQGTGMCAFYGKQVVNEQLQSSNNQTYVRIDFECLRINVGSNTRRFRRRRGIQVSKPDGYYPWRSWSPCSVTCGTGEQRRTRICRRRSECDQSTLSDTKVCTLAPCLQGEAVKATWAEWSAWSTCSESCGDGFKTRNRSCATYAGCKGDTVERQKCSQGVCNVWTEWSQWSFCSQFCGGGQRTRARGCTTYGKCPGNASEEMPCNQHACCTEWSTWGPCSVTCGRPTDGTERRTRRCTSSDSQKTAGNYASETETEERPCNSYPTPCGDWSNWAPWGQCTATCAGGDRKRTRSCSVPGACTGNDSEWSVCHADPCPTWAEWAPWSVCSVSCGAGTQLRQRICSTTGQCDGGSDQQQGCSNKPCPEWTDWGTWSYCSESCGGGLKQRCRTCSQENQCSGDSKDKDHCNTHTCPTFGEWSGWSDCSQNCNGGVQSRTRPCSRDEIFCTNDKLNDPACVCTGGSDEERSCHDHACATWSNWGEWEPCSAECGGGKRTRTRNCRKDATFCVGTNTNHPSCVCEGAGSEEADCHTHACPNWSTWAEWGDCSVSCGGGSRERNRDCKYDVEFCTADKMHTFSCKCPGHDLEYDQCNVRICPHLTNWGSWSGCSTACAGGEMVRARVCQIDTNYCASNPPDPACECDGAIKEEAHCNMHTCAHVLEWSEWSSCSVSCGGGIKNRERKCSVDSSFCFGENLASHPSCKCSEAMDDQEVCNDFACPRHTEWDEWAECSVTCGLGERKRSRGCIVDSDHCTGDNLQNYECRCAGNDIAVAKCDKGECWTWNSWESWGKCSRVCGGGSRKRARKCPSAGACPGLTTAEEFCNQLPCPDWGSWAIWSSCSVTCGGGKRVRTRSCPLDGGCSPGNPTDNLDCNDNICPEWSTWGAWGACSATCGKGERIQRRVCEPTDGCLGRSEKYDPCNIRDCAPPTNNWSAWSPCTQTCGGGTMTRSRLECIDPGCDVESEKAPCSEQLCPQWAQWASWTTCSKTCGGGFRIRTRKCADVATGVEVSRGCIGKAKGIDPVACNAFGC